MDAVEPLRVGVQRPHAHGDRAGDDGAADARRGARRACGRDEGAGVLSGRTARARTEKPPSRGHTCLTAPAVVPGVGLRVDLAAVGPRPTRRSPLQSTSHPSHRSTSHRIDRHAPGSRSAPWGTPSRTRRSGRVVPAVNLTSVGWVAVAVAQAHRAGDAGLGRVGCPGVGLPGILGAASTAPASAGPVSAAGASVDSPSRRPRHRAPVSSCPASVAPASSAVSTATASAPASAAGAGSEGRRRARRRRRGSAWPQDTAPLRGLSRSLSHHLLAARIAPRTLRGCATSPDPTTGDPPSPLWRGARRVHGHRATRCGRSSGCACPSARGVPSDRAVGMPLFSQIFNRSAGRTVAEASTAGRSPPVGVRSLDRLRLTIGAQRVATVDFAVTAESGEGAQRDRLRGGVVSGLEATGWVPKTVAEIRDELVSDLRDRLGADVDVSANPCWARSSPSRPRSSASSGSWWARSTPARGLRRGLGRRPPTALSARLPPASQRAPGPKGTACAWPSPIPPRSPLARVSTPQATRATFWVTTATVTGVGVGSAQCHRGRRGADGWPHPRARGHADDHRHARVGVDRRHQPHRRDARHRHRDRRASGWRAQSLQRSASSPVDAIAAQVAEVSASRR